MKLFKTIHFDQSDTHVYGVTAGNDEWAVSGAFAFTTESSQTISGKIKQAFTNGFLSLESMGRATFVSVAEITKDEEASLCQRLAEHFHEHYGAPTVKSAMGPAQSEIEFAKNICAEQSINTVFTVKRFFDDKEQIREEYRIVTPPQEPIHTRVWDIVEDE